MIHPFYADRALIFRVHFTFASCPPDLRAFKRKAEADSKQKKKSWPFNNMITEWVANFPMVTWE